MSLASRPMILGFLCAAAAATLACGQKASDVPQTVAAPDPPAREPGEAAPVEVVEPVAAEAEAVEVAAPVEVPQVPTDLSVEGYNPASHVGPDEKTSWPKPVTVVLHGNYDRPEWECDTWKEVAGFHGWVLCPRGVRTPHATLSEDRWTYRGPAAVQKEIDASLAALDARYPGLVDVEKVVLAGFSLGAIYAPGLALNSPGRYPLLFLVEGGMKKIDRPMTKRLARAGVRGVAMAMSAPGRRRMARDATRLFARQGIATVFVDMRGAGHGYRGDFGTTGRAGFESLIAQTSERPADAGVSR